MGLAADIGLRGIVLGVERVEVLLEPLVGRDAGIDRAANRLGRSGLHDEGVLRWFVPQAEEFRPVPAGAGDREGDLGQAGIGLAVPGKAVGQHRHPLHLPVPFAAQHGARLQACGGPAQGHGALPGLLGRPRATGGQSGANAPPPRQSHGRCICDGSIRSAFRRSRSAKASPRQWVSRMPMPRNRRVRRHHSWSRSRIR